MKKPRPPAGMLIFNLRFWIVLSVVIDNGTNAFNFHSRKLDNTIRRTEQRYSNHPIDSVYDSSPYPSNFKKSPIRPNFNGMAKNRAFSSYPGSKVHELSNSDFDGLPSDIQFMSSKRNANDKPQFLNHTTIVAHLVNGIYLQSGLINGKIPIDELVGELFNFGSVTVSDIVNFKSDKVTALANKLKAVRDSLSNENDADAVEKQTLEWNGWLAKSQSVINFNLDTIPNKAEYLKEISSIVSSKLFDLVTEVDNANSAVELAFTNIDNNLKLPLANDNELSMLALSFNQLRIVFEAYNKGVGELKNAINSLDSSYPWLKKGPEVFEPLEKMIDLMKSRNQKMTSSPDRIKVIKENVKKVLGPVEDAKSSSRDVLTIESLTKHQANSHLKTIKHTEGFSNALSDLKQLVNDVRDPWIASILGLETPKLNEISDGLQPLFGINGKIDEVNKKLKPISSNDFYNSLLNFKKLQVGTSTLSSESGDHAGILNDYESCAKKNAEASSNEMDTEVKYIDNIRLLKNGLSSLSQMFEKVDVSKLKEETDAFIKYLGFKNLEDPVSTKTEIPGVVGKLKKDGELNKIKKSITVYHSIFGDFTTANGLNTAATSIKNTVNTIPSSVFKGAITREKGFFGCVKQLSDKAEKLAQAVTVIQNLRTLQDKDIGNVALASSVVSELSKSLSSIKPIPETMKKEAKEVTKELNRMPDIEKNYKSIGQTVRSLQYAFALKQLESSIPSLKNVETVVQSEIHQISDLELRKSVEKQWGDHMKHVTELENSIVKIKAFESKIDVSKAKTMGEYGDPLKEMVTLSDANINPNDKIQALETLIPLATDPKVKLELEEVKKTLETISTLDLTFSSHNGQFQSAPGAFNAFQKFLTKFLSVEHNRSTNKSLAFNWENLIIPLLILLITVLFFAFGFTEFCRWNSSKKCRKFWEGDIKSNEDMTSTPEERLLWAENQRYKDQTAANGVHSGIMEMMKTDGKDIACRICDVAEFNKREKEKNAKEAKRAKKEDVAKAAERRKKAKKSKKANRPKRKRPHRYGNMHCNPATSVTFKTGLTWTFSKDYYNANWVKTYSGVEFIAAEGPITAEEIKENEKRAGEKERKIWKNELTDESFWCMVLFYKLKFIVMLCSFDEQLEEKDETGKKHLAVDENGDPKMRRKCGVYFSKEVGGSVECGRFTITTKSVTKNSNELVIKRELEIVDTSKFGKRLLSLGHKFRKHTITHFQYTGWPDMGVPNGYENVMEILNGVKGSDRPVLVHCSAGVGRTVSFIGLQFIYDAIVRDPTLVMYNAIAKMRSSRYEGVQKDHQSYYVQVGVVYKLWEEEKDPATKNALWKIYNDLNDMRTADSKAPPK